MIFETSRQAKFMIPMAISLGFGILFSTTITLVLVPAQVSHVGAIRHQQAVQTLAPHVPTHGLQPRVHFRQW